MRNVAGQRDESVVVIGTHRNDVGTYLAKDAVQGAVDLGLGRLGGGQHPIAALEQVGPGALQATKLGTRHRVTAEEPRIAHLVNDRTLDPGDVSRDQRLIRERRGPIPRRRASPPR